MEAEEPQIVDYAAFVRDLEKGGIADVQLYSYGREIEMTYRTAEGGLRASRKPFQLTEDELLTRTLSERGIEFVTHDQAYPGESSWIRDGMLSTLVVLLIPVLMLLVMMRQARTIRDLGAQIAAMAAAGTAKESAGSE